MPASSLPLPIAVVCAPMSDVAFNPASIRKYRLLIHDGRPRNVRTSVACTSAPLRTQLNSVLTRRSVILPRFIVGASSGYVECRRSASSQTVPNCTSGRCTSKHISRNRGLARNRPCCEWTTVPTVHASCLELELVPCGHLSPPYFCLQAELPSPCHMNLALAHSEHLPFRATPKRLHFHLGPPHSKPF